MYIIKFLIIRHRLIIKNVNFWIIIRKVDYKKYNIE